MELYTKESINEYIDKNNGKDYVLPKKIFNEMGNIRLETKLAYVALLDTLVHKANYTKDNIAYIKIDNPEIQKSLTYLANKEVDLEKIEKYVNELSEAELIKVEKQNIFVYNLG